MRAREAACCRAELGTSHPVRLPLRLLRAKRGNSRLRRKHRPVCALLTYGYNRALLLLLAHFRDVFILQISSYNNLTESG